MRKEINLLLLFLGIVVGIVLIYGSLHIFKSLDVLHKHGGAGMYGCGLFLTGIIAFLGGLFTPFILPVITWVKSYGD